MLWRFDRRLPEISSRGQSSRAAPRSRRNRTNPLRLYSAIHPILSGHTQCAPDLAECIEDESSQVLDCAETNKSHSGDKISSPFLRHSLLQR